MLATCNSRGCDQDDTIIEWDFCPTTAKPLPTHALLEAAATAAANVVLNPNDTGGVTEV